MHCCGTRRRGGRYSMTASRRAWPTQPAADEALFVNERGETHRRQPQHHLPAPRRTSSSTRHRSSCGLLDGVLRRELLESRAACVRSGADAGRSGHGGRSPARQFPARSDPGRACRRRAGGALAVTPPSRSPPPCMTPRRAAGPCDRAFEHRSLREMPLPASPLNVSDTTAAAVLDAARNASRRHGHRIHAAGRSRHRPRPPRRGAPGADVRRARDSLLRLRSPPALGADRCGRTARHACSPAAMPMRSWSSSNT